ncbi:voltage-gated chloride channel family protein [Bacillus pumilus]|uniref:voltage-gated chloride channel family protein n=1 Tax=Bacillus TaxID=1386 RepID=UPI000D0238C6|nr:MULTISPECIES: voltage-gated chloride channel family protein [Bacillus]MBR0622638.1 voltage-gated chloride channel family protein [Bacillus pumilus]MBU5258395.1 voltage-gated chloride channel family protein [Bacillus pumilus]MCW6698834.1 voltage-gated chloride channel family protein [Bacillus sp. RP12]PRS59538.1 voltage-gated chloride channel protein [Bacillus sp. GBSW19]PRS71538.1 voltage-gated chloride channel protein [Bacillus sp. NMTD17]
MLLKYKDFFSILGQWIFFGSIIGIVIGTTTNFLLETNDYLGDDIRAKRDWLIFLLPFGGIIIGYIYMKYGKVFLNNTLNDTAELNNLVIDSVHGKKEVPRRMGPIVFFGTFITILFGGSTGREGAAVQMGGSVAAAVNKFFKVNRFDKKVLIISGISAGFGSAFGAPITGTVFGMEMAALGKLKFEALVPCLVASFVGHYITTAAWGHKHEEFIIQTVPEISSITFLKVILIAVIFSLISVLYCQLRHGIQNFSEKLFKKNHMKRAFFGGIVIVGLTLIVGSQDFNGRGLQMLQQTFSEEVPPFAFLAKLVFTAVTLGSGFVGGEAIPLFFIGATLGNALHTFIDLPMSFLAALGLIAVFCGGANTPIAAFLLAMEMFDGKGLEYFFVACLVSYLFSGYHGLWPSQKIYNPKSRLYNLPQGETLENVKKRKKSTKQN